MKWKFVTLMAVLAFGTVAPVRAEEPKPAASESEEEESKAAGEAPTDALIRKLGAMTPDQTFKRGEPAPSKGGAAPEGTMVYPVQILGADGKLLFDANFFKDPKDGKWAVYDSAGNVMHSTD